MLGCLDLVKHFYHNVPHPYPPDVEQRVSMACFCDIKKGSDRFWQIGDKHGDLYASVLATRAAITARALVEPFIALLPPSSNSIQPSLKPSSIRMRGSGFLIPCERNSSSQDSRGTGTAHTGFPMTRAKESARSLGVIRLGPSSSTMRVRVQSSRMSLAAKRPTSFARPLGTPFLSAAGSCE